MGSACTPGAVTLGAAAGVTIFMGGADLAYHLGTSAHAHVVQTLLAAAVGAGLAVVCHRSLMGQAVGVTTADSVGMEKKDVESLGKLPNGDSGDWDVVERCEGHQDW